ncbi:MAG: hypothetical protein JM58_11025 [Peptococcaceae bacterium BICA1-8]|nr:MAG: hypothetical protein JM58_11025 [Peptococcaceae bacterium BICA1-8]
MKERILICIDEIIPLLKDRQIKKPNAVELLIEDKFIGEGYGIPTPEALFAIKQLAKHEGIVLDYTYTGKAMAGLLNYIEQGIIKPGEKVLFWHTGGAPVLTNIEDRWREFL